MSPDKANRLTQLVTNHPSINMYAINNSGQDLRVGVEEGGVTGEFKASENDAMASTHSTC